MAVLYRKRTRNVILKYPCAGNLLIDLKNTCYDTYVIYLTGEVKDSFIAKAHDQFSKILFLGYSAQTYPLKYLYDYTDKDTDLHPVVYDIAYF